MTTFGTTARVISLHGDRQGGSVVASIVVRGLDESVKKQLAAPHIGLALMEAVREAGGAEELAVPERTDSARVSDLG